MLQMQLTNFPESRPTTCRGIKTSDLRNCASARKALPSNECKQSRVAFALAYVCVSRSGFLERTVFTDEKTFKSCSDGRIPVYRPPNSRVEEQYVSGLALVGELVRGLTLIPILIF
jgi:hypothetical protein